MTGQILSCNSKRWKWPCQIKLVGIPCTRSSISRMGRRWSGHAMPLFSFPLFLSANNTRQEGRGCYCWGPCPMSLWVVTLLYLVGFFFLFLSFFLIDIFSDVFFPSVTPTHAPSTTKITALDSQGRTGHTLVCLQLFRWLLLRGKILWLIRII